MPYKYSEDLMFPERFWPPFAYKMQCCLSIRVPYIDIYPRRARQYCHDVAQPISMLEPIGANQLVKCRVSIRLGDAVDMFPRETRRLEMIQDLNSAQKRCPVQRISTADKPWHLRAMHGL